MKKQITQHLEVVVDIDYLEFASSKVTKNCPKISSSKVCYIFVKRIKILRHEGSDNLHLKIVLLLLHMVFRVNNKRFFKFKKL
jgi:hypothetical protein